MKNWPYILIIILLIVIIALEDRNHKLEREKLLSKEYDLQQQLQQTESELEATRRSRNLANRASDSLLIHSKTLAARLKAKDREIASLKGKYNNVPVDSLSRLMEDRASWKKRN